MLTQHNRKSARLSPDYTFARYMSWGCGLGMRLVQLGINCTRINGSECTSIGYTLKARWLSDLFNRVPKARGE